MARADARGTTRPISGLSIMPGPSLEAERGKKTLD
jgi:hypothetical protein